jgi:hypothetical protein
MWLSIGWWTCALLLWEPTSHCCVHTPALLENVIVDRLVNMCPVVMGTYVSLLCSQRSNSTHTFTFSISNIHHNAIYCHALSDYRRGLDWQLDLLESNTDTLNYNRVPPDSLTHNSCGIPCHQSSSLGLLNFSVPFLFFALGILALFIIRDISPLDGL